MRMLSSNKVNGNKNVTNVLSYAGRRVYNEYIFTTGQDGGTATVADGTGGGSGCKISTTEGTIHSN